ncbi:hypothetical protein B9D02_22145 (plasmid) [Pantoea vagans]|nr:hypothetical protein B9D02_22145 [Pantoea vagans]
MFNTVACRRSGPATVRARHFIPAGFRPQDGKRQKERSDILFMFEEYKPLMIGGAATDAAITITVMDIILARSFRNK